MCMLPLSTIRSPLTALRKVDLPAPLLPMTVTNSPSLMCRLMPRMAGFSMAVPGLKVTFRLAARIMVSVSFSDGV